MNKVKFLMFFFLLPGVLFASKINLNTSLSSMNQLPVHCPSVPPDETDSLRRIVQKCNSDTAKFDILYNYFWKYAETDLKRVRHLGTWAYEIIKNSGNLRALSDGYDMRGYILEMEKRYDSAYYFFRKALGTSKKIGYKSRMGWSYYHLGIINEAQGNTDSALYCLKFLYSFDIENEFFQHACQALDQIASIYQNHGKRDSAMAYRNQIIEPSGKIRDTTSRIFAWLDVVLYYSKHQDTKKVLLYLNEAMKLAEKGKNKNAMTKIYFLIGDLFFKQKKNYEIAINYYQKVLEFCDKADKYMRASALNMIGKAFLEEGKYELALLYSKEGLDLSRSIHYKHQVSEAYRNLGQIYKNEGKLPEAINNFQLCFDTGCDKCPKIKFHAALTDIADSYLKLNNRQKALDYYEQSLALAITFDSEREMAISKLKLGNYYRQMDKEKSRTNYEEAIQLAKNSKDIYIIKIVADTLSAFFRDKNDYKSAYANHVLARNMQDSINHIEQKESMANWEMKFEFEKINKENEAREVMAKEEIGRQKIFRNSAVLISVLLGLLGIVVFLSYRRKNKDNLLLTIQRDEIIDKNREIESQMDKIVYQRNEIEKISTKLHESDQAKLRFFANISHELRTPLTLIVSPLVKLMKCELTETARQLYPIMLRNTRKLQEMINQLLDISKIDKEELVLDLQMHDLNSQLRVIAAMFQSIAEEKKIDFHITALQEDLCFCFDAGRVEQVINNLLSNAFKYTPSNGKIEIKLAKENDLVIIQVLDSGLGIPAESLGKVFDRFYQTDVTLSRHIEGSGIGLALTKELVELHHGRISVASELGKWTEFTVSLPFVQKNNISTMDDLNALKLDEGKYLQEQELNKNAPEKHKNSVLLVEDNKDLRSYMSQSLSVNYVVIEANNGTEGIDLAKREIPDIIISDVMMPETDGYQMASTIKSNIETCHIPIILLTAKAGRESKIRGLETGADDYINKPFDEEELLLKIKNILHNRQKLQDKYKKRISPNPSEIKETSMDEQFIVKLICLIEKDLSNKGMDVDYLAGHIGLSRQQLYRKLKAITGLSPVEFIRSIRLKRAAQLIKQRTATVSEIAFLTGFENLSYFSKRFKEEFGLLPSEYSKQEN
jgi:signal transduction histidine kinase/DNA-binding response OmpR family regulator